MIACCLTAAFNSRDLLILVLVVFLVEDEVFLDNVPLNLSGSFQALLNFGDKIHLVVGHSSNSSLVREGRMEKRW